MRESEITGAEPATTPQVAQTAWVVVIEPGGSCNRYRWDDARGALTLERVEQPDGEAEGRGADLARLPLLSSTPGSLPEDPSLVAAGPGLLALTLASPANPRGTWLEARILGAFRVVEARAGQTGESEGALTDYIALAVPVADPTLASVTSVETLTPDLRERAHRALRAIAPDADARISQGLYPTEVPTEATGSGWLGSAEIMARFRAGRAEASRLAAARRKQEAETRVERLTTDAEAAGEALLRRLGREAAAASTGATTVSHAGDKDGAWRGLVGVSPAELRARGAAVYGEPEDLLRWMPSRFARYLGELLYADERALYFAAANGLELRGWSGEASLTTTDIDMGSMRRAGRGWLPERLFGGRGARRLNDGLLLITDRQILSLRDYAPVDGAGIQLGFLARNWPLGRLVAVSAAQAGVTLAEALRAWPERVLARLCPPLPFDEVTAPPEQTARLILALEGRAGVQLTGMAFPAAAGHAIARAETLLHSFTPLLGDAGRGDWRLRRVPQVTVWRPSESEARELETLGGLIGSAATQALAEATQRALAPDELVLAQGRTPRRAGAGADIPALLTLTPRRLLVATAPPRGQASVEELPLGELASVALNYSLMGSWLAVTRPITSSPTGAAPSCEETRVAFPSTLIAPFRALGNRVHTLLEAGVSHSATLSARHL